MKQYIAIFCLLLIPQSSNASWLSNTYNIILAYAESLTPVIKTVIAKPVASMQVLGTFITEKTRSILTTKRPSTGQVIIAGIATSVLIYTGIKATRYVTGYLSNKYPELTIALTRVQNTITTISWVAWTGSTLHRIFRWIQ